MKLQELFRQLSLVELSNLSMGESGEGTIRPKDRSSVVVHINDGINELHQRFVIKEKVLILSEIEGKSDYILHSDYAVSKALETPGPHYIIDTEAAPFKDDLLKILQVEDSAGNDYKLNVADDIMSLFTPEEGILQIPYPNPDRSLAIAYQAKAEWLMSEDELTRDLSIPTLLVPALRSFVAGRVYSSKNSAEFMAIGQKHTVDYENHCERVKMYDLLNQGQFSVSSKFYDNGWV
jgi:hypothetical protein